MQYQKSATAPDWYESDESKLYACATSGSSPFNEWYEFGDRTEAVAFIAREFSSQSFVEKFGEFSGEIYGYDQFTSESLADADDAEDYVLKEGAKSATLGELIDAEIRF